MSQTQGASKEIDGKEYTMFQLAPMRSHDLLMDVVKMVGPSLGPVLDALISGSKDGKSVTLDTEIGPDFFTRAASSLFTSLDKATVKRVIDTFASVTMVEGSDGKLESHLEAHFIGRLAALYKWVAWGMAVQWGGLFSALGESTAAQGAIATALSQFRKG